MKFSIVIPTLDRAALLRHALTSAVEQDFDDYEVVVSNNSSQDDTEQVARGFEKHGVRLVRTERRLSMVDHWEFALSHARGDYVLFLCDDDALLPCALRHLQHVLEQCGRPPIVEYDQLNFVYDDGVRADGNYLDVGERVPLVVRRVDSRRRLSDVFWRMNREMPKFLNCAVSRELISRVREAHGRVFGIWAPDYAVGPKLLAHTDSYVKTGPLMLWGENMQSYGSGARRDPERMLGFFRQFDEFDGRLPYSPYPELITVMNSVYDTLCRVREALGPEFAGLAIDPLRHRRLLLADVRWYLERGHESFREDQERIGRDYRRLRLQRGLNPLDGLDRVARRARLLPERLQRMRARKRAASLGGPLERRRFSDIADAARYAGGLADPRIG